jgi:hypothetical protein
MVTRILSLDGGGTWALLQAMALQNLFGEAPGHQILAKFDLAVANSGGSITLGGLVEDMTPGEIISLFTQQANRQGIFAKTSFVENLLAHIPIFPKYSTAGKLTGLTHVFGALGNLPMSSFQGGGWPAGPNGDPVKLMITAFDYYAARARLFRSYGTSHGATADDIPLVQAVHASSDSPVAFFDAPTSWGGRSFWGGAMAGLNNPLMTGITDLLSDGVKAEDLVVLSLGTGTVKLPAIQPAPPIPAPPVDLAEQPEPPGVLNDLKKAAGCITDDPPDTAAFTAHVLIASARGEDPTAVGSLVRLSPVVRPVLTGQEWELPQGLDIEQFQGLKQLGMDAVEQAEVQLIVDLGHSWLTDGARNQPIRMNSNDLSSSLGEEVYSMAKARWLALCQRAPPI